MSQCLIAVPQYGLGKVDNVFALGFYVWYGRWDVKWKK